MVWVGYDGQGVADYDYIGTDTLRYSFTDGYDIKEAVGEIRRRCGCLARIESFKKENGEIDGD